MEDLKDSEANAASAPSPAVPAAVTTAESPPTATPPRRKRWVSALLYLLATCGLLFLASSATPCSRHPRPRNASPSTKPL